jgi:integrase
MQAADVKFSQLDSAAVDSFLGALRARGVQRVPGPRGLRPLVDYLDSEGALALNPVPDSRWSSWSAAGKRAGQRGRGQGPGLRSIEVARLELGDIDWRAGEIAVAGKARRRDRLPLPHDVGQALIAYLCEARPATSIWAVFLMLKAPIRPIRADLVGDVTRWACSVLNDRAQPVLALLTRASLVVVPACQPLGHRA